MDIKVGTARNIQFSEQPDQPRVAQDNLSGKLR